MVRENQIQQIAYKVDNSIYEWITYQPTLRIDLQFLKKQLLVYQETVFIKRVFDILFISVALIVGLLIFLILDAPTKLTLRVQIFYKQVRIGKYEKPFYIYKFRSMLVDAEKCGFQLASNDDPRITKWGNFM